MNGSWKRKIAKRKEQLGAIYWRNPTVDKLRRRAPFVNQSRGRPVTDAEPIKKISIFTFILRKLPVPLIAR